MHRKIKNVMIGKGRRESNNVSVLTSVENIRMFVVQTPIPNQCLAPISVWTKPCTIFVMIMHTNCFTPSSLAAEHSGFSSSATTSELQHRTREECALFPSSTKYLRKTHTKLTFKEIFLTMKRTSYCNTYSPIAKVSMDSYLLSFTEVCLMSFSLPSQW